MAAQPVTLRPKARRAKSDRQTLPGLVMAGPVVVLLLLFVIVPFFMAIYYSFTNQRLISGNPTEVVGMRNYQRLLGLSLLTVDPVIDPATGEPMADEEGNVVYPRSRDYTRDEEAYPQYAGMREWFTVEIGGRLTYVLAGDPLFMRSLTNNFFFALVVIPLQTGIGLLLALMVNQGLKGQTFFRTMYFAPVVTSLVVVSIVWRFLFDVNNGLINEMISTLTFGAVGPINWLGNPSIAMWAIIIVSVWQGAGMQMMLFVAGLQQIPESLYEAAGIDGANGWQKFRYITIPGLRNVLVFIFLTITIAAFQLFDQVLMMTNGGPDDATTTTVFHMYRNGFREQDIGYASAIAVVFFLIIVLVNVIQRRAVRERSA